MEPGIPCIVTGVMDKWKAMRAWRLEKFQNDPRIKEGVYIGQREEMIPLRVYYDYIKNHAHKNKSKWMVFMPDVFDLYPSLSQDYTVPDFFSEDDDFMTKVDEDLRLDWRWIIMAPKKSGSGWHVDPANTTRWLALVTGAKLWGLYPPSQYHIPGVKNNYYQKRDYEMDDAYNWWVYTRPHLFSKQPLECVQKAREMMFIPSGWWHSVVNLDDTVAVTQNFCNKYSFKSCLKELKEQADSDGLFIGKTFEQLRDLYSNQYQGYFDKDDMNFHAPETGIGKTAHEIKEKRIEKLKEILSGKY
ncbi:bifunctional arginine demethylase and lysyl-hydroxylase PSR-like [Actinia tenebrosa]|uniref:Bifunctional arginine demethylase and lysyl-hydroxylase PSR-like n=1 Tax=Actinia tenebrosa TaxID=6105 RepID=A0A6P8IP95_ACTTE|nr:bifunctional arginine demethylase and lysyl-hydroxylase PSR-like [Actinia tenebrosa]